MLQSKNKKSGERKNLPPLSIYKLYAYVSRMPTSPGRVKLTRGLPPRLAPAGYGATAPSRPCGVCSQSSHLIRPSVELRLRRGFESCTRQERTDVRDWCVQPSKQCITRIFNASCIRFTYAHLPLGAGLPPRLAPAGYARKARISFALRLNCASGEALKVIRGRSVLTYVTGADNFRNEASGVS